MWVVGRKSVFHMGFLGSGSSNPPKRLNGWNLKIMVSKFVSSPFPGADFQVNHVKLQGEISLQKPAVWKTETPSLSVLFFRISTWDILEINLNNLNKSTADGPTYLANLFGG